MDTTRRQSPLQGAVIITRDDLPGYMILRPIEALYITAMVMDAGPGIRFLAWHSSENAAWRSLEQMRATATKEGGA